MTNRNSGLHAAMLIVALILAGLAASPGRAADEPDLIFKRSTVFKWLTPNDKLATYGLDDPEVDGVA
jgi:CreA protein